MKKVTRLIAALALCAAVVSVLPLSGEEQVYEKTVRLHILAASDGEEDQKIKLGVRDAVLPVSAFLLEDCESKEEALTVLRENQTLLCETAKEYLKSIGRDDTVSVEIGREIYPTREYSGFRLPAGEYDSVRISIGKAEGHNWWCVLFPSLCLSASEGEASEAFLAAGFTPEQIQTLCGTETKYRLRFRILEWLEEVFR